MTNLSDITITPEEALRLLQNRTLITNAGCWEWQGSRTLAGYGRVYGSVGTPGIYAHRLAVWAAHGLADDQVCCHHCDNPPCCNPTHLYAGTMADNIGDAVRRGRLKVPAPMCGEDNYQAKPDALVNEVRERYLAGEMQKDLAAEYGISLGSVRSWVSGGGRGRTPIKRARAACGTRSGYCSHVSRKESACQPCREANTAYLREYKARKKNQWTGEAA